MCTLTVAAQEAVEQLEEREAAPAVGRLRLQDGVHVGPEQGQEGFGVLLHQLRPAGEGLHTPQKKSEAQQIDSGLPPLAAAGNTPGFHGVKGRKRAAASPRRPSDRRRRRQTPQNSP